jgi:Flp pilus assembly protein TadD
MLFYWIFGGVIGVCVIGVIVMLVRTFPEVSHIDVELLARERDAKRKREIMEQRFGRWADGKKARLSSKLSPTLSSVGEWFARRHQSLVTMERRLHKAARLARDPQGYRQELLEAAEKAADEGEHEEAERRLIEMVSVNARDYDAYRRLAELYMDARDYGEAKEVYSFLVKAGLKQSCGVRGDEADAEPSARAEACGASLAERTELARHFAGLGLACQELKQGKEAVRAFDNAVAFEPGNPRYLDLLLEACILEGQKSTAERALAQLSEANPDNSKLEAFRERVAELA